MTKCARAGGILVLLLAGLLPAGFSAAGNPTTLAPTQYYATALGVPMLALHSLIQTAQASGFATIVRLGDVVTTALGTEPTDLGEEILLTASPLLYVDDSDFLFQVRGADLDYVVRPAASGYALLLVPQRTLPLEEALAAVRPVLERLGIVKAGQAFDFIPFARGLEKVPPPPQGVSIDSALYGLFLAEDWFGYAAANGLERVGLRVKVVAEKNPGQPIPEAFQSVVTSETPDLARLLIPIHRLIELARSASVAYVRPAYRPVPQAP